MLQARREDFVYIPLGIESTLQIGSAQPPTQNLPAANGDLDKLLLQSRNAKLEALLERLLERLS